MTIIKSDLYVVAHLDAEGNVVGYPQGGGSSTSPKIRAQETLASAKRARAHVGGTVMRVTAMEIADNPVSAADQNLRDFTLLAALCSFMEDNDVSPDGVITADEVGQLEAFVDSVEETGATPEDMIAIAVKMLRDVLDRILTAAESEVTTDVASGE